MKSFYICSSDKMLFFEFIKDFRDTGIEETNPSPVFLFEFTKSGPQGVLKYHKYEADFNEEEMLALKLRFDIKDKMIWRS